MDTVTQVNLPTAALGPTHQSNPVPPKPGAGASGGATTSSAASAKSESHKSSKTKNEGGAVDEFLNNLRTATTRLRISQDEKMGVFVYQSVDPSSGEVKAQYPSEERLRELAFLAQVDSKKNGTTI
jgi:uncharacterized FlaG/YvyC family protein